MVQTSPAIEWLLSVNSKGKTHSIHLNKTVTCFGRSASADVRLLSSRVSRRHAEITVDESGRLQLTDLQSHNGTEVNQERLVGSRQLEAGDRISIGRWNFVVEQKTHSPPNGSHVENGESKSHGTLTLGSSDKMGSLNEGSSQWDASNSMSLLEIGSDTDIHPMNDAPSGLLSAAGSLVRNPAKDPIEGLIGGPTDASTEDLDEEPAEDPFEDLAKEPVEDSEEPAEDVIEKSTQDSVKVNVNLNDDGILLEPHADAPQPAAGLPPPETSLIPPHTNASSAFSAPALVEIKVPATAPPAAQLPAAELPAAKPPVAALPAAETPADPKVLQPSQATLSAARKLMEAANRKRNIPPTGAVEPIAPTAPVLPVAPMPAQPVASAPPFREPAATPVFAPQALPGMEKPRQTIKVIEPAAATLLAAQKMMEAASRNKKNPAPVVVVTQEPMPKSQAPAFAMQESAATMEPARPLPPVRPKARDISPVNEQKSMDIGATSLGAVQNFVQSQTMEPDGGKRQQALCAFAIGTSFAPSVVAVIHQADDGTWSIPGQPAQSLPGAVLHLDANLIEVTVKRQTAMVAWDTCLDNGTPAVALCCPLVTGECFYAATTLPNATTAWLILLAQTAFMERLICQVRQNR